MVDIKFMNAIEIISGRLIKEQIKWVLAGSTNMALQGIDTNPKDLDIVVRFGDLNKMQLLFPEYSPSQITKLKPIVNVAWEVKLNIHGVEVQILGEKDSGVYVNKLLGNKLTYIKLKTLEIPCLTLEAESQAYAETNRQNKADKIREFININLQ
jgi:hypothetical protein